MIITHKAFRHPSSRRLRAAVWVAALLLAWLMPSQAPAADDWLKVEEEKPLHGQPAPQAGLDKKAEAMKRYLARFRESLGKMKKILADSDRLLGELATKNKAFKSVEGKMDTLAKDMFEGVKLETHKYKTLVSTNPHFKFLDPGQDPDFKKRGDDIIENGRKMCELAKKWAKSKDKQERGKLKKDLLSLKDQTKDQRDKLKADFQAMITAMQPIYHSLEAYLKKMTPANKRQLVTYYGIVLQGILDISAKYEELTKAREPFRKEVQKAADAAQIVANYLDNNPKLPGVPDPAAIRKEIATKNSTAPLIKQFDQQWNKIRDYDLFMKWYDMLDKSPGIPAVKLALSTGNHVVIYSASKDLFSRFMNSAVDLMYKTKLAVEEIEKRKRLLDQEWARSKDKLKSYWECVKKWMAKKPVRSFKGTLKQGFSARLIQPKSGNKCASHRAECSPVQAEVQALLDPEKEAGSLEAKAVPELWIDVHAKKGLFCSGVKYKRNYRLYYTVKYDPAKGVISVNKPNWTLKGKQSGSGLVFEEVRTFQKSYSCGRVEFRVHTKGSLKEGAPDAGAKGVDLAGPEGLMPLSQPDEAAASSAP